MTQSGPIDIAKPGELAALRAENARLRAALAPFQPAFDQCLTAGAAMDGNEIVALYAKLSEIRTLITALENSHDQPQR